jgi:hypothetical protein
MSGHRGEGLCHVEINRSGTDDVIYLTETKTITFNDPTWVVPVYFRLHNCVFPAPGIYYVGVFNNSKLIGERPLHLRQEG